MIESHGCIPHVKERPEGTKNKADPFVAQSGSQASGASRKKSRSFIHSVVVVTSVPHQVWDELQQESSIFRYYE